MSSLLKALRQQQSPLVNQGSELAPGMLQRSQGGSPGVSWMVVAAALLVIALVAALGWQLLSQSNPQPIVEQQKKQPEPAGYQLGASYQVTAMSWDAAPVEQPSEPEPMIVNPEGQRTGPANQPREREPVDLNQVSPELLAKFEQAVQQSNYNDADSTANANDAIVPPLSSLNSSFRSQVRPFTYDGHMYVSNTAERWVELNQQRLYINDRFDGLRIERIEPQRVVFSLNGKAFSVEALQDWRGQ